MNDFNYLAIQLDEIHPDPYLFVSKEDLEHDLDELSSRAGTLSKLEIYFELMKIFAEIKDSHTRIKGICGNLSSKKFPIHFKFLSGKCYIVSVLSGKKEFVGNEVISINGFSIKNIVSKIEKYIAYENNIVLNNALEQWLYEPDMLKYIGIVNDDLLLKIETKNGWFSLCPVEDCTDLFDPRAINVCNIETLSPHGLYWTKVFKDYDTFFLQYNSCDDITNAEVLEIIDEIKKYGCKYIVVDLRNNVGGSSLILDPLTNFLLENQDKYIPVVFLSAFTYSSAIINALNILDCKNAMSIGTKTSGSPTKFGEAEMINLPCTNINFFISTKYFEEDGFSYGQPLSPIIEVEQNIDNYLQAIDVEWNCFIRWRN